MTRVGVLGYEWSHDESYNPTRYSSSTKHHPPHPDAAWSGAIPIVPAHIDTTRTFLRLCFNDGTRLVAYLMVLPFNDDDKVSAASCSTRCQDRRKHQLRRYCILLCGALQHFSHDWGGGGSPLSLLFYFILFLLRGR